MEIILWHSWEAKFKSFVVWLNLNHISINSHPTGFCWFDIHKSQWESQTKQKLLRKYLQLITENKLYLLLFSFLLNTWEILALRSISDKKEMFLKKIFLKALLKAFEAFVETSPNLGGKLRGENFLKAFIIMFKIFSPSRSFIKCEAAHKCWQNLKGKLENFFHRKVPKAQFFLVATSLVKEDKLLSFWKLH